MESSKHLILTMSIGDSRNFISITYPYLKRYADKCGADLIVLDKHSELFREKFKDIVCGRKVNSICYILKVYSIYHYLENYEKILWLDDTCMIKKHTDNLFDMVPPGHIGGYNEGELKCLNSWKYDKKFIYTQKKFDICERNYLNSGVVVYTRECRHLLSPESIYEHKDLFQSDYPHQAFLNYQLQSNSIPLTLFDKNFNALMVCCEYNQKGQQIKGNNLCADIIDKDSICIYHITGFYINRLQLLQRLHEIFTSKDL